jgi:hypothetical protein
MVLRCEPVKTGLRRHIRKGVQTFADSNRMAFRCRIRLLGDCAETIAVLSIPNGSVRDRKLVTKVVLSYKNVKRKIFPIGLIPAPFLSRHSAHCLSVRSSLGPSPLFRLHVRSADTLPPPVGFYFLS